jgi:hypothetical protein
MAGHSDVALMFGFIAFFILSGLTISAVNNWFTGSTQSFNTEGIESESKKDLSELNAVSALKVLGEIAKMSVWTFGSIPTVIDLIIFVPIRLIFWFIVIRTALGSGG